MSYVQKWSNHRKLGNYAICSTFHPFYNQPKQTTPSHRNVGHEINKIRMIQFSWLLWPEISVYLHLGFYKLLNVELESLYINIFCLSQYKIILRSEKSTVERKLPWSETNLPMYIRNLYNKFGIRDTEITHKMGWDRAILVRYCKMLVSQKNKYSSYVLRLVTSTLSYGGHAWHPTCLEMSKLATVYSRFFFISYCIVLLFSVVFSSDMFYSFKLY